VNPRRAFTLVELIVVSVIGVMVAGAIVTSVSSLQRARASSLGRQQAFGRAEAAAGRIALDLSNVVRHHDLRFVRIAVVSAGTPEAKRDDLLMLARSSRPVRGEDLAPEGADYEIQYRIMPGAANAPALWRRIDPALDQFLDAGGVASALVAGVTSLAVQCSNGSEWFDAWDSDSDGVPHAVRVTVVAASDDGRFSATARRLVAMDRPPLPLADDTADASGGTPASGSTGGAR
jgi:prepilin-type N-terminal cleavage/methylation domain-containing protein